MDSGVSISTMLRLGVGFLLFFTPTAVCFYYTYKSPTLPTLLAGMGRPGPLGGMVDAAAFTTDTRVSQYGFQRALALPWMLLGIDLFHVGAQFNRLMGLDSLLTGLPAFLPTAAVVVIAIGIWIFEWPRRLLPRWYQRDIAEDEARAAARAAAATATAAQAAVSAKERKPPGERAEAGTADTTPLVSTRDARGTHLTGDRGT